VHVEDQRGTAVVGCHLEIWRHHDRSERAGLDAQGALDAAAHVQVKAIEDFLPALGTRMLMDLDHVYRTGNSARPACRAAQVAAVEVIDQPRAAAGPDGHLHPLLGVLNGDRLYDQYVLQGRQHTLGDTKA
jgi:hypothetical protein